MVGLINGAKYAQDSYYIRCCENNKTVRDIFGKLVFSTDDSNLLVLILGEKNTVSILKGDHY